MDREIGSGKISSNYIISFDLFHKYLVYEKDIAFKWLS